MEPTLMKSLDRLSADTDSEENESEPGDEPEFEPHSLHQEQAIRYLQTMYQKLYTVKDAKDVPHR